MGSFSLSGGVEVFGFISPSDTTDTYPVIDPLYGIDGLRNVDLLSDLNNIPTLRRRAGMIVGVSGGTIYYKLNPSPWNNTITDWSIFSSGGSSGDYLPLSGGTVSGGTQFTNGLSANTISGGSIVITDNIDSINRDLFDSSGYYSIDWQNRKLFKNDGSTIILDWAIGQLFNLVSLESTSISATTYQNLPTDIFVTGGTYLNGVATFENNTGGTFSISGFSSAQTFSGGVIYGQTIFSNGLTATTISATTYLNLPSDIYVSGGTYSNGSILFTNSTGGTFIVSGLTIPFTGGSVSGATQFTNGLTANTISATTYLNLPTDFNTYITGFTYQNNTFSISDNTGSTLSATINSVTGLTINGNLSVTGTSDLQGIISSNSLSGNTDRVLQVNSGGTLTATTQIIDAYISSATTAASLLSDTNNWDINGNYIGAAITGTFQGQKYYNSNYFFEAILDNIFIRLIRG